MKHLRVVAMVLVTGLVALGADYSFRISAERRSAEFIEKVKRSAPIREERARVESNLRLESLSYEYVPSSRTIVGPPIPIGRVLIFWKRQFQFEITFNEQDRVASFHTALSNSIP